MSAQPHPRLPLVLAASRSALDAFARFAPNKVLENEVESSIRPGRISGAATVYVDGPAATHESVTTPVDLWLPVFGSPHPADAPSVPAAGEARRRGAVARLMLRLFRLLGIG